MAIPATVSKAQGEWKGQSRLHLSWLPDDQKIQESESSLSIKIDKNQSFARLDYSWSNEDGLQEGALLLASSSASDAVTGGWSDSWHQSGAVMALSGADTDSGTKVSGHYAVEGHPDWGWKIELESKDKDTLVLRMTNVSPEGEEDWAVEAKYSRT